MFDVRRKRRAVDQVGYWWHSIDLGDGIVTPGQKTPEILADELAGIALPDLTGKSVLDIGGWDGFFAFEAERRGAARVAVLDQQVWSVDLAGTHAYWRECQAAGVAPDPQEEHKFIDRVGLPGKAGFDLARRELNSSVETIVADFEHDDLDQFGKWDVVLFLGVLYHLRNPFDALTRLRSITGELAIIETHAHTFSDDAPLWRFYPGAELNNDPSNWWVPNMAGLQATLAAAEFGTVDVKRAAPDPAAREYRAIVHAR
jgi:tRNA (mo5U34)-methyltransferase